MITMKDCEELRFNIIPDENGQITLRFFGSQEREDGESTNTILETKDFYQARDLIYGLGFSMDGNSDGKQIIFNSIGGEYSSYGIGKENDEYYGIAVKRPDGSIKLSSDGTTTIVPGDKYTMESEEP